MSKPARSRTPGGGPFMTLFAVLLLLLPVLFLGFWVEMTPEGKAAWQATLRQAPSEP